MLNKPAQDALPGWVARVATELSALPRDKLYLVGVSGGMDSCVLLDLLLEFGFCNLVVCHFNHRLRGAASDADEAFVEGTARQRGLAFHSGTAAGWSARKSLETAARDARFAFFAEAARLHGAHELFLGHHADDQVETFIFRLLRGTASLGRAAMHRRTEHRIAAVPMVFYRPLLAVWRAELLAYARARRLAWRDDATNAEPVGARNRLRHELIPLAEAIMGRKVGPCLLRCLQIAQDEESFLDAATPDLWQQAELPADALRALPVALQRRVLHRWLKRHAVPDVGLIEIDATRHLLDKLHPAKINLPGGNCARRRAGKIFVEFRSSPPGTGSSPDEGLRRQERPQRTPCE